MAGDDQKPPDFGEIADLATGLRDISHKKAFDMLAALSMSNASGSLAAAITELLTNIQQLEKSISKLTGVIESLHPALDKGVSKLTP